MKKPSNTEITYLLAEAAEYVRENIKAIGGCDHAVGICCCGILRNGS